MISFEICAEHDGAAEHMLVGESVGGVVVQTFVPQTLGGDPHALSFVLPEHDLNAQLVPGHLEFLDPLANEFGELLDDEGGPAGVVPESGAELGDGRFQHALHLGGVELLVLLRLELVSVLGFGHVRQVIFCLCSQFQYKEAGCGPILRLALKLLLARESLTRIFSLSLLSILQRLSSNLSSLITKRLSSFLSDCRQIRVLQGNFLKVQVQHSRTVSLKWYFQGWDRRFSVSLERARTQSLSWAAVDGRSMEALLRMLTVSRVGQLKQLHLRLMGMVFFSTGVFYFYLLSIISLMIILMFRGANTCILGLEVLVVRMLLVAGALRMAMEVRWLSDSRSQENQAEMLVLSSTSSLLAQSQQMRLCLAFVSASFY